MAQEVGAKMWHMYNYESLGLLHGLSFDTPEGERSKLVLSWPELNHGSVLMVVDDGKRYFNEAGPNRHGHIFDHGIWRVPRSHEKPYIIFDQKQYETIEAGQIPYDKFNEKLIRADTLEELAKKTGVDANVLNKQVEMFNRFVENGHDDQFGRDIKSMDKFKDVKLDKDQYLGESNAGIGGKLIVRVTYDNEIKNVEIVQNHESEDVGKRVLKVIPERIVKENTPDVDAVSGASVTSRAISEAVRKALKNVKE